MIELEAMSQEPLSVMPRRVKCHGKEPVRVHFPQIEGRTSPIAFPGLSALMVGAKYFLSGRSIYDDCFTLVRLAAHRVRGSSQSRASVFSTPRHADRTVAWNSVGSLAASCGDGNRSLHACPADRG